MKNFDGFLEYVDRVEPDDRSLTYLLVMPRIIVEDDQQYIFPFGLPYISSAMKTAGYQVKTLNLNYKNDSLDTILSQHLEGVDVLMTGGLSSQFNVLQEIITTAKKIKPSLIVVVGGGIITADPEPAMQALENTDYGCIGEGEITDCELAEALEGRRDKSSVKGIIYWENGRLVKTPPREEIKNLDVIPWPDYEGFEYGKMIGKPPVEIVLGGGEYSRMGTFVYSRGCPYLCTFCFHTAGNHYRHRSLDSFFEEFDYVVKTYQIDCFNFIDEYFMRNMTFVRDFCERVKPYHMKWAAQGRVDNVTDEMVATMKNAGCYALQFGIESACDEILRSMRKNITVAQIDNALNICLRHGVESTGSLIFGDKNETLDTVKTTLDWYRAHREYRINLSWIMVYPGTNLYYYAIEQGLINDKSEYLRKGDWFINVSKLSDEERKQVAQTILQTKYGFHDKLIDPRAEKGNNRKISVWGECPYCGFGSTYQNIDLIRPRVYYVCPNCSRSLNLFGIDYLHLDYERLHEYFIGHKIAIWPVIINLYEVLEYLHVDNYENICIVDSDIYKQGTLIAGKRVLSPDHIAEAGVDVVLISMATPLSKEIIDTISAKYPCVKEIKYLSNLLLENSVEGELGT